MPNSLFTLSDCLLPFAEDLGGGGCVGVSGGKFGANDAKLEMALLEGRLGGKGVESVSEGELKP